MTIAEPKPDLRVRPATVGDLSALVDIHVMAFEGFTLTILGKRFLRLLYRAFIEYPDGILLVACDDAGERPLGFVAGTKSPDVFFSRLRREKAVKFCIAALPGLIRHPVCITERLIAALRYNGDALPELPGYCLLSSIAVSPQASGRGIGARLVEAFGSKAANRSAPGVYLATDADDNAWVRTFYTRNGFQDRASVTRPNGRKMVLYAKELQ